MMESDNSTRTTPAEALTARELEILRLIANGLSDREIAETIILTVGTVKWYNRQIYSKLHVGNRTEAIAQAQRLGLLQTATPPSYVEALTLTKHNLPAHVTSFIGRSAELTEIKQLLHVIRLLTLSGPPGTGKTRLAQAAAIDMLESFKDGVFFVSLAPIADPTLVINSIAQVLGIGEQGSESMLDAVKRHLANRSLLLILDNFEHLLPASSIVSELLMAAPQLRILVTSREILHLYGEHEYPVSPLQLPDLKQSPSAVAIKPCESVDLFVQRAKAALPTFQLNDENASSVDAICVQVDGLPLAIELAAAHIKFYAPQTLLLRLSSRLDVLSDGPRDLPARQRTLRSTLAWSYGLLADEEKILFARLGIFAGGWTQEDAQIICASNLEHSVSAGLESLVNKSLVQTQNTDHETRFSLLETMREYALEKLETSGEKAFICDQHAQHFLGLAEAAAQEIHGTTAENWFQRLETEHDNLRAALRWSLQTGKAQISLRFIAGLARFWEVRGYFSEGRAWLTQTRSLKESQQPSKALADALQGVGDLAYIQSDYESSQSLYEEAVSIYQELKDEKGAAHAMVGLGNVATEVGDYDTAPILFEQAYAIMHQLGDVRGCARTRTQLGWCALRVGNLAQARTWLQEGLSLYRIVEDKVDIALTYSGLGEVAIRQGELTEAHMWLQSSLTLRQELGEKWGFAAALGSLAWVVLRQHDYEQAVEILEESLLMRKELGDKGGIAWCLEKMAEIALEQGDMQRTVRILGAAAAIRTSVKSVIDPVDQAHHEQIIEQLQTKLGMTIFETLWSEGQTMQDDQIIQYVFPAARK